MAIAINKDWRDTLKGGWLLWDTSAIIKTIQYESEDLFGELISVDVENLYIHPVELELLATKIKNDRLKRSDILASYLRPTAFTKRELDMAKRLQTAIGVAAQPSPADLYIGATIAASNSQKFYLITHNIKDFPAPYFIKNGYITLYTDTGVCSLALLSFDHSSL